MWKLWEAFIDFVALMATTVCWPWHLFCDATEESREARRRNLPIWRSWQDWTAAGQEALLEQARQELCHLPRLWSNFPAQCFWFDVERRVFMMQINLGPKRVAVGPCDTSGSYLAWSHPSVAVEGSEPALTIDTLSPWTGQRARLISQHLTPEEVRLLTHSRRRLFAAASRALSTGAPV